MRKERISSLLKTEIASILLKSVNDSRIQFISITEVKLAKDMNSAEIFYSQIGSETEREQTARALRSAKSFIHAELCKAIRYMPIPRLYFKFDPRLEKNMNLVNKIRKLTEE